MNDSASSSAARWAVVGGGVLGLALARRLAQAGQNVTVFEAAPEIGGLASAWQLGDVAWDRHYHVTLLSDSRLRRLLADLGLDRDMRWVETKTGFFTDGRLHSMSTSLEFLKFPPLRLVDKLRLAGTILGASRRTDWKPLEQVLVADWLRRWSGERTFRKIWEPLLLAKLGECYRRTNAAFIWATIQRMYRARKSGLKKEMFGYLPGGYARFFKRLAQDLDDRGVELRTSTRVVEVCSSEEHGPSPELAGEPRPPVPGPRGGPASRVLVRWRGADGEESIEHFDRVILTAPSPIVTQLCPELGDAQRGKHESIEYLGVVCASVLLKQPLAQYYVTNITDPGLPFTAVIEMTTLVDRGEFRGRSLVYLPRYAAGDDAIWKQSDGEIEERFLAGLERMYPDFRRDHVEAFRISRARHVMALPTLGYSERLPPLATNVPGVFAINSAHIVKGTLNVNEILELADAAFDEVVKPALLTPHPGAAPLQRPQPLATAPA